MKKIALILLGGWLAISCGDPKFAPYLGRWTGGFQVTSVTSKLPFNNSRYDMKGFLQLYATEKRFTMHLEGEQEELEAKGTWTIADKQIELDVARIKFDDRGGQEARDPNRPFIAIDDLRKAFDRKIPLRIKTTGSSLQGIVTDIGPIQGNLFFDKTPIIRN